MKFLKIEIVCFLVLRLTVFSNVIYNLGKEEVIYNIHDKKNFSFVYRESDSSLKNPIDISFENFKSENNQITNNICEHDYLSPSLKEISSVIFSSEPFYNPEFLYQEPYLYYVDEMMNKINYKKLLFDKGNNTFIVLETNSFNKRIPDIRKNSLIRFFFQKSFSTIIICINEYIYKIKIDEMGPILLDEAKFLPGININEISDLILFDSGLFFLNQSKSISFYCENNLTNKELYLVQVIDHINLKLSGDMNITCIYFDETTKNLFFSDYSNGVYMFAFDKNNTFIFKNRLNNGNVLKIDFYETSLILIKELFKKNLSSIVLQEYLKSNGEFLFNREIYLSSSPKFQSFVRTSEFFAIVEPNLIHLYRTSLKVDLIKLEEIEIYKEFHTENILKIKPISIKSKFNEFFILAVFQDHIRILQPIISSINLNCHMPDSIFSNEKAEFSLEFDMNIKYLSCLEKEEAINGKNENFCQKTVNLIINWSRSQNDIISLINSNEFIQLILIISAGTCVGLILALLIGICLKKKYNALKNNYAMLENQYSQSQSTKNHLDTLNSSKPINLNINE